MDSKASRAFITGTMATSRSKSILMLLLASMKEVTIHAKLFNLSHTVPTTLLPITELASQSSKILTLHSLNTMSMFALNRRFMVLEEDLSMPLLVQTVQTTHRATENNTDKSKPTNQEISTSINLEEEAEATAMTTLTLTTMTLTTMTAMTAMAMTMIVAEATAKTTIVAEAEATEEEEATGEEAGATAEATEEAEDSEQSESALMLDTADIKDILDMPFMLAKETATIVIVTVIKVMDLAIIQLIPMHHLPETTLGMEEVKLSTAKEAAI